MPGVWPIRSLNFKLNLHSTTLTSLLCVSETWLCPDITDSEILDTSYQIFRNDRNHNGGGGVLVACKSTLMPSRRCEFEPSPTIQTNFKQCELIWVQVILPQNKGKLLVGTCYRPPSSTAGFDDRDALAFSFNRILQCSHQFKSIFLLGDFNLRIPCTSLPDVHLQNPSVLDCHSAFVRDITESLGMSQLVFFPTRRNPHGDDSMLDLIFCNNPNWTANIHQGPGLGNSDHDSVHFSITTAFPNQVLRRTFCQFHKADITDFKTTLECIPWNLFYDDTDIDETWENFTTLIHAAVKDTVPIATKGRRRSPRITREIINVSRKKNRMYRKAVAHKNNVNLWNKYKDLRVLVKRMTKTSYNDYIHNLSDDCKLNPKRFWSFVKSKRESHPVNVFKQGDSNFSTSSQTHLMLILKAFSPTAIHRAPQSFL